MARYVRGQVCGVDNCPSRLWKRVDGRNVCQYGHINEFDVEINDDDEMLGGGGGGGGGGSAISGGEFSRRLVNVAGLTTSLSVRNKVSRLSSEKTSARKYGEEFEKLQARCFQIILSKNTRFVIEELQMPSELASRYRKLVKLIWMKLLECSLNRRLDTSTGRYDIGHLCLINYLAMIEMNIPITLADYIKLTFNQKFNLERSEYCLPRELKVQIPISKIRIFHGHLLHNYSHLLTKRFAMCYIKERKETFKKSRLNYYSLLVRTILNLFLPLEICKLVKNCVDLLKIDFSYSDLLENRLHPELRLMSLVMIFSKVHFIVNPESFNIWYCRYTEFATNDNNQTFVNFRKQISFNSSFNQLRNWSDQQIMQFLQFYNRDVLPNISSSNIASSNEYKDRNELRIAKSIQDIFQTSLTIGPTKVTSQAYMDFLSQVYTHTPSDIGNTKMDSGVFDAILLSHISCMYNFNNFDDLFKIVTGEFSVLKATANITEFRRYEHRN